MTDLTSSKMNNIIDMSSYFVFPLERYKSQSIYANSLSKLDKLIFLLPHLSDFTYYTVKPILSMGNRLDYLINKYIVEIQVL